MMILSIHHQAAEITNEIHLCIIPLNGIVTVDVHSQLQISYTVKLYDNYNIIIIIVNVINALVLHHVCDL